MLEAHVERGLAVLYYADAAHPTHNTRCTRAWCAVSQQRPLLTVSGRERVNLNAYCPFTRLPEFGPDLASLLTRKFHILDAQLTS